VKAFDVFWHGDDIVSEEKVDSAWWCLGNGSARVATVSKVGVEGSVDVYCDGEMKLVNLENGESYYCASDLEAAGLSTDKDILVGSMWEWVNNSWFDVYDTETGEHLDLVEDNIISALDSARNYLDDLPMNTDPDKILCGCGCLFDLPEVDFKL
jgi:hypothetical protein